MSIKPTIMVIGANPAWQKLLKFDSLAINSVNRAHSMQQFASGKGINFSRSVRCLGYCQPLLIHFLGGSNGERITQALQAEDINHLPVFISGETRCCSTLLADGNATEIIEPSGSISELECEEFRKQIDNSIDKCSAIAICGSPPDQNSEQLYFAAARAAFANKRVFFVDYYKNLDQIYAANANTILKINRHELFTAAQCDSIVDGINFLRNKFNAKLTIITDGSSGCYLLNDGQLFYAEVPRLPVVVNPIGCGDSFGGAFLSEYLLNGDAKTAFKSGIAAGSANCLSELCGSYDPKVLQEFANGIKIKSI